jgi:hypothetical protein
MCYHARFQNLTISGYIVSPTAEVHKTSMLELLDRKLNHNMWNCLSSMILREV